MFLDRLSRDNVSVLAAAVAFYAMLSVFPALSALISLYGLVADPAIVRSQIASLQGVVPDEAIMLLAKWLDSLLQRPRAGFGLSLLLGVSISLWLARSATGTMIVALNIAFERKDERGIVHYNIAAFSITAVLVLFGIVGIVLVAMLPILIGLLPLPPAFAIVLSLVRWTLLAVMMIVAIATVYRFGPAGGNRGGQWSSAGAAFATALWIAGSIGFSLYVSQFANYDRTYGSIGALIVLLLWFWLGAYAVLAGAELNAVMQKSRTSAPLRT